MHLTTLLTFNLKYYRHHFLLLMLCVMGISLGVGIVVAVELINTSALTSFRSSVDFLSGRATHSVVASYGHIDEREFARIWKHPSVEAATPLVEAMAVTIETGAEPIRFLGVDSFLDRAFREFAPGGEEKELIDFLAGDPPGVFLSERLMKQHGLKPGGSLTVLMAGIEKQLRILGNLPGSADVVTGDNVALLDIAAAQEVFGRFGYLDRIDVIVKGSVEELRAALPDVMRITDANSRKSTLTTMLASFQLNLAAMSLLALFVGIFLIYNFSMFSVLSRREDMSLLLTLGSDRRGLVAAFLVESLLVGAVGSVVGLGFGFLVAWFSIEKVSSTITELYFYVNVGSVQLTVPVVLTGLGVGIVATLIGIGLPALEVAVTPPILGMKRRSIEDRAHGVKGLLSVAGGACLVASLAAAWGSRFSIFWGFASAFGMTVAFALWTPWFLSHFTHRAGIFLRQYLCALEAFLAARMVRASLSRTSMSVAALAVALSMTIGVDTMILSFRQSVSDWLEGALQGDLYISPGTTKWDHPLPEALVTALLHDPRVAGLERYSTYEIFVDDRPAKLRVLDAAVLERHTRFTFLAGKEGAWEGMKQGGVFISEPFSYRFCLKPGDRVVIPTPEGKRAFPIVAVTRDYSSDQGTIQMDRAVYERIWKDARIQSLALFLKPGVSRDEIRREIATRFPGLDRTMVSNVRMREDILTIFDKTFAPTATLKGVSMLVALLGVATALSAILMERSREMKVLGYLGLTPWQLGAMNTYQALIMGLAACLLSVVCGLALSGIIIEAINYRSFGWSVDLHVDPRVFVRTFLLTGLACLASSLYPTFLVIRRHAPRTVDEE